MSADLGKFFKSGKYAVVGASPNTAKFGWKVLDWYVKHGLDVVPVNPKEKTIMGRSTVADVQSLADPSNTSISVVTPPAVSKHVLEEAVRRKVPSVWFQPGSFNDEVLKVAAGSSTEIIAHGRCILVEGESGLDKVRSSL